MGRDTPFAKLLRNPLGAGGLFIVIATLFIAMFAYALIPDDSPSANQIQLQLAGKKPGFEGLFLRVPIQEVPEQSFLDKLWSGTNPKYRLIPIEKWELAEQSIEYEEYTGDASSGAMKQVLLTKFPEGFKENAHIQSKTFYLGTDKYGRDLLSRLLLGTRVSFSVGFVSVFISLLIGIPLGAIAGFYGGWVDKVVMWFINVIWSIPTLLMVIAITLALGKGFWQVFVAVGFTMWVEVARVVRGQFLSLREKEYVQAAKVLGFSNYRIIIKHILPNAMAPVIVISAANFAAAILIESGLSFLGIGAQPPMPSWGSMIKDHYAYLIVDKAYLAVAPGLAIMFLVLAFMMLGNSLRDILDVRGA